MKAERKTKAQLILDLTEAHNRVRRCEQQEAELSSKREGSAENNFTTERHD